MKIIRSIIEKLDRKFLWYLDTKEEKLILLSGILLLLNMVLVLIFRNLYIWIPLQIIATVLMVRSNNKLINNKYKENDENK